MERSLTPEEALTFLEKVVRRYVPGTDAEDIASSALIKALKSASTGSLTYSYLRQAAQWSLANWLRQRSRAQEATQQALDEFARSEPGFASVELQVDLVNQLSQLNEADRIFAVAVILAAMEGIEDKALARYLGMPASTFSSRKLRILSAIDLS